MIKLSDQTEDHSRCDACRKSSERMEELFDALTETYRAHAEKYKEDYPAFESGNSENLFVSMEFLRFLINNLTASKPVIGPPMLDMLMQDFG